MDRDPGLETFLNEAIELIDEFESGVLELESDLDAADFSGPLRIAHTLKGSSGVVGLQHISDFVHMLENVLTVARDCPERRTPLFLNLVLGANDLIRTELRVLGGQVEHQAELRLDERRAELLVEFERFAPTADGARAELRIVPEMEIFDEVDGDLSSWHLMLEIDAQAFREGCRPLQVIDRLETIAEQLDVVIRPGSMPTLSELDPSLACMNFEVRFSSAASADEIADLVADCGGLVRLRPMAEDGFIVDDTLPMVETLAEIASNESSKPEQRTKARKRAPSEAWVKVPATHLADLVDQIAEFVVCESKVRTQAARIADPQLDRVLEEFATLMAGIRESTLGLRTVQIGQIFTRFRRLVRELSGELGKQLRFETDGGETELDKGVVDRVFEPLMHMVRNAIDHGIELPERRRELGKAEAGTIRLAARQGSGNVIIEISDDGAGIDTDAVVAQAKRRGVLANDDVLSEAEALDLIFHSGLSTAQEVTQISGRGVGMDVVRSQIEAIGGHVSIRSQRGVGTRFSLELPLTLAIIEGFLVACGTTHLIFPMDQVLECLDTTEYELHLQGCFGWAHLHGRMLPLVHAGRFLGLGEHEDARPSLLVVRAGSDIAAVVVDRAHGQHQTVVKPLGPYFAQNDNFTGATILGDGRVAMIVNTSALVHRAAQYSRSQHTGPGSGGQATAQIQSEQETVRAC